MKKQIRQCLLAQREALSHEEISEKSWSIFQKLKGFSLYSNAKSIMVYMNFRSEVQTDPIINDLLKSDKKVMIPVTIPKTKEMIVSELLNPQTELEKTRFGISEPKEQYIRKRDPEKLDLIILPGVAFSLQGYRIGYGAGYYDRFFSRLKKKIPSLALAFQMQVISTFPPDPHDHKIDYIITEKQIIPCK